MQKDDWWSALCCGGGCKEERATDLSKVIHTHRLRITRIDATAVENEFFLSQSTRKTSVVYIKMRSLSHARLSDAWKVFQLKFTLRLPWPWWLRAAGYKSFSVNFCLKNRCWINYFYIDGNFIVDQNTSSDFIIQQLSLVLLTLIADK